MCEYEQLHTGSIALPRVGSKVVRIDSISWPDVVKGD